MKEDTIELKQWITKNGMMYNTDYLDYDDPDCTYNQILAQGKVPEDYGIFNRLHERFKDFSRGKLINEVIRLEKELTEVLRIAQVY